MAYIITRLQVGDYEAWKPMFEQDGPGAREDALGWRLFRSDGNPGEVHILIEYASVEDARAGRERLMASGVLDRFTDKTPPIVVEECEDFRR
jgi:hypothetical protein